ncbi:MAG: class I SAM-dependent methyltransferase [Chlorobiaceae bacterium]|nr:class I SAM-dependent methyltransferase [Chlorobiaceae bacterium]NTV61870.1 class I SAM-dependent methyltransferase [Chlorobiaceae bacterium]
MTGSNDTSGTGSESPWFAEWFNHPFYLEVYSHRDRKEASLCIGTILDVTGIGMKNPTSVSILDIACGAGRHAVELASQGYCVTGNDLSPYLLEEARKEALKCKVNLVLSCCDMREIRADGEFDLVLQLFTSFGYFETDEDDLLVFRKVHRALKKGGWYVLDLINPLYLEKNIVPESSRSAGDLALTEKRKIENGRITKTISITSADGSASVFTESVKLYSLGEIRSMLDSEGLPIVNVAGSYDGEPFREESSPRMMIFSRKP